MSTPTKTGILLAALVATGLAGCAHQIALPVSGPPLGYEQRHPILLTRSTHSATLDVGRHSGGLSSLQRTEVEGFARSFRVDGTGELSIHVPAGAPNERTAFGMAGDIQSVLVSNGVPPNGVVVRAYQPTPGVSAPPILLSYGRVRAAVPHRCGVTADMDIDFEGRQWENMGCADRQNFAAMIANPNDLVTPRPMDRIDGAHRYRVIDTWRAGQDTTTQVRNEAAGTITRTGR